MIELHYIKRIKDEKKNHPLIYHCIGQTNPNDYTPLHRHPHLEIIRVLNGNLKVHIEGRGLVLTSGDLLIIAKDSIHGLFPRDCEYEIINFDINSCFQENALDNSLLTPLVDTNLYLFSLYSSENIALRNIADKLFEIAVEQSGYHDLLILGVVFEFLGMLVSKSDTVKRINTSKNAELFKPLLEYIESSYMNQISLSCMAKLTGMSISHFSILFRNFFQMTPMEYLNAYRMEQACLFLTNTDLSVTEIAYSCGFNDSAYFTKVFKKHKKTTPKKYRTEHLISA